MLPSYLHMLKVMNPDTITHLVVDRDQKFKYPFITLGTSIKGFKETKSIIVPSTEELYAAHMHNFVADVEPPNAIVDKWMNLILSGSNIFFEDIWRNDVNSVHEERGEYKDISQREVFIGACEGDDRNDDIGGQIRIQHNEVGDDCGSTAQGDNGLVHFTDSSFQF
ncbi:hypothetical protein L484_006309 [Morus notabilis]|uniref:Uncharacterized protein n=1 Tax=Morus notabilis TaxID=981085 RepID=W9QIJ0_9ROSA|nr:hypothetical protein L484_006309 [Morus notabilis]